MSSFSAFIYCAIAFTAGRSLSWAQVATLRQVIAKRDARIEHLLDELDYATGADLRRAMAAHPAGKGNVLPLARRGNGRL